MIVDESTELRSPRVQPAARAERFVDEDGLVEVRVTRARKPSKGKFMLLVRRIHLYSGLALLPWVLLYGVTALLFNHPGLFSPREVRDLELAPAIASTWTKDTDPDQLARGVVAALRARAETDETRANFGEPRAAKLSGVLRYSLREERTRELGRDHTLEIDAEARRAKLYSTPAASKPAPAPFAVKRDLALARDPFEDGKDEARAVLASAGITAEPAGYRSAPSLEFELPAGGETWLATYSFRDRSLSAVPIASAPEPLAVRSFLTRLHTAHGFTPARDSAWAWAWIVDAMGVTMVFWGVSGALMWWQMKRLRGIGSLVIAGSIVAAVLLAAGMYAAVA